MSWDAIGAIGEVVGAGAVVLTLAYLALQVRHAKVAADDTNRLTRANGVREMLLSVASNPALRNAQIRASGHEPYYEAFSEASGISTEEAGSLEYQCQYWFWLHWGQFASSTSARDLDELRNLVNAFYRAPYMHFSWEHSPNVKPLLEPAFVSFVDEVLAGPAPSEAAPLVNWEAISAAGEVAGAIGVIASLLYLSLQIRKSDQTARAESLRSVLDGYRERSVVHSFTDPDVADLFSRGLTDFDALSPTDKRRFFYLFAENVFQTQQAMQLFENGLLDAVDYEAWRYYTATLVQTPGGTKVWPYIATTITPTIRQVIDEFIAANPDTPSYLDLNPLMRYEGDAP